MKISLIAPAIRTERWLTMYESIKIDYDWEIVIVSPYDLPDSLKNKNNIKFIKDYGAPMRASCIAMSESKGKYFTWVADDGVLVDNTLNKAISMLDSSNNTKKIIVMNYIESGPSHCFSGQPQPDWMFQLNVAYPKTAYIPDSWKIMNCFLMHKEYYDYLGGWDAAFEATPLGQADLAVRAQRDGCEIEILNEPMISCGHMAGTSGDHAPVHYGQTEHDEPLYKQIYSSPECVNRIKIDIENWKKSPPRWLRRFPN
jgi:hypothetical protein